MILHKSVGLKALIAIAHFADEETEAKKNRTTNQSD